MKTVVNLESNEKPLTVAFKTIETGDYYHLEGDASVIWLKVNIPNQGVDICDGRLGYWPGETRVIKIEEITIKV